MSIRKVYLAKCDECGQEVEVPERRGLLASHPSNWWTITLGAESFVACSVKCAQAWVEKHWPDAVATPEAKTTE